MNGVADFPRDPIDYATQATAEGVVAEIRQLEGAHPQEKLQEFDG